MLILQSGEGCCFESRNIWGEVKKSLSQEDQNNSVLDKFYNVLHYNNRLKEIYYV